MAWLGYLSGQMYRSFNTKIAIPDRQCDLVRIFLCWSFSLRVGGAYTEAVLRRDPMYHGRHPCYWKDSFECAPALELRE